MADVSQTAANVALSSGGTPEDVTFGDTVTAGMAVYYDEADDGKWKPALTTSAAGVKAAGEDGIAVALNGGADGQPGRIVRKSSGEALLNLGATLAVGARYYVSKNNAGGIMPESDLASTNYVTLLGIARTSSLLLYDPIVLNAQVP